MPFLFNIPQPTDLLSVSQANLLNNNQILGAIAGNANVNSSLLNANAGFNFLYLQNQGVAPTFVAGTANIWVQNSASTGNNELFIRNDTTTAGIPITASAQALFGWCYLPSGNILKWGQAPVAASPTVINFQALSGGPNYTHVWQVLLTPEDSSANANFTCGLHLANTTTISVYANNPSGTTSVIYLVIGN